MKTFEQWLAEYTKEHGCPPAHIMAEAAFRFAFRQGYVCAWEDFPHGEYKIFEYPLTGDSDLKE